LTVDLDIDGARTRIQSTDKSFTMARGLEERDIKVVGEGKEVFVEVDGIRIARRGPAGLQKSMWISLEPGWQVFDGENFETVAIRYKSTQLQ
jgi:hypothetical protein